MAISTLKNGIAASLKTLLATTALFLLSQVVSAQNTGSLQYSFQPSQALRYRLNLQHEIKMSGGNGPELPVVTKIVFQASVRMAEVDSAGVATLEARAEGFSARTAIGSKETSSPVSAAGQSVKFKIGPYGLLPGQEALSGSSDLPWSLFLSQVFPDLTRCRYLGPAVFNGKPCAKIGFDVVAPPSSVQTGKSGAGQTKGYNQGQGTGLFADGRLVSGETQGKIDLGYSVKGTFSSRLSLTP